VASHQSSQTELGINNIGPFPLSPGADDEGRTRVSAVRLFQEWTERSSQHVLAARSQFSLGLDVLGATVNDDAPDSRFFAWRGEGQWVRLLAEDTLLLLRSEVQLASQPLLPIEQIGIGGQRTVRGYRQDALLTDNGVLASAEVRVPIVRIPEIDGILQVAPFIAIGAGWNIGSSDPNQNILVGTGLGLVWQMGNNLSARLDWGVPLVSIESERRSWQENGLYFSIIYTPSF
jgi:hemolysin activation/secretion protein